MAAHAEDAADPYLPLMIWYGVEPAVPGDVARAPPPGRPVAHPLVRRYVTQRIAAARRGQSMTRMWYVLAALLPALGGGPEAGRFAARCPGSGAGDDRRRGDSARHPPRYERAAQRPAKVAAPAGWSAVHRKLADNPDAEVRERVLALSVLFGDAQAMAALRRTVDVEGRTRHARAGDGAAGARRGRPDRSAPDAAGRCRSPRRRHSRPGPIRRASTPALLLRYPTLSDAEKADVVATLASRPAYALALLDAIAKKALPRTTPPRSRHGSCSR
ncbi:MAG: hypothetical protein U0736_23705 [Gemmataceae bacterium]